MGTFVDARHFAKKAVYRLLPKRAQEEIDHRFYFRRLIAGTLVPEDELSLLKYFVEPETSALDVGANLGGYAVALSPLVGPKGEVHAFEPVPRSYRLLCRNIGKLHLPNVRLHCLAVSDHVGQTTFYVPLEGALENFYVASLIRPSVRTLAIPIETTGLDAWREGHPGPPVSFIKIDVEGVELSVLSGAKRLIAADAPTILCEIGLGPRDGTHTEKDVFALCRTLGYVLFQLDGGRLVRRDNDHDRNGVNFILLHESRLERFRPLMQG